MLNHDLSNFLMTENSKTLGTILYNILFRAEVVHFFNTCTFTVSNFRTFFCDQDKYRMSAMVLAIRHSTSLVGRFLCVTF